MNTVNPDIYRLAGEYADAVRAFAIHESKEDGHALGDAGQAYGLLQMHPDTFARYYLAGKGPLAPSTKDTWTISFIKACATYLLSRQWLDANDTERGLIVMAWNLGEHAVFIDGDRNAEYLAAWHEAMNQIHGEENT